MARRGTIRHLVDNGFLPDTPAQMNSLPLPVLEDLCRAMTTDMFALNMAIQTTVVKGAGKSHVSTQAAMHTLQNMDAAVLLLLKSGKLRLNFSIYEMLWCILPVTALALEAARTYYRAEPSP